MTRLVIHPEDPTTDFLAKIYEGVPDTKVIRSGAKPYKLIREVEKADQVIMLGHGSQMGLFTGYWFDEKWGCRPSMLVCDFWGPLLAKKDNNIGIWCHANSFFRHHKLRGFRTGMFVSEVGEAWCMGLGEVQQSVVNQSNRAFAQYMNEAIDMPLGDMIVHVCKSYGELAKYNPVAKYNHARLHRS